MVENKKILSFILIVVVCIILIYVFIQTTSKELECGDGVCSEEENCSSCLADCPCDRPDMNYCNITDPAADVRGCVEKICEIPSDMNVTECPCIGVDNYEGPEILYTFGSHIETGYVSEGGCIEDLYPHNPQLPFCFADCPEQYEDWFNQLDKKSSIGFEAMINAVMNILDKHNAKGTFLFFPELAAAHETLIKKLLDEGHDVGVHIHLTHSPDVCTPPSNVTSAIDFIKEKKKLVDDIAVKYGHDEKISSCNVADLIDLNPGEEEEFYKGIAESGCVIE